MRILSRQARLIIPQHKILDLPLAYLIAGHHAGLPDGHKADMGANFAVLWADV